MIPPSLLMACQDPCALTVLQSTNPYRLLAKRFSIAGNGIAADLVQFPYQYRHVPVIPEPRNIHGLRLALAALVERRDLCVIRGSLTSEMALQGVDIVARRSRPRPSEPRCFEEAPRGRNWLCLDIDGVPCPANIDPRQDPEAAICHVVSRLPKEFHGRSVVYHWSSSMGVRGWGELRVHLWYWLTTPVRNAQLKHWAKHVQAPARVDSHLFNPVHIHFTADPIFVPPARDPFPHGTRLGLLEGSDE